MQLREQPWNFKWLTWVSMKEREREKIKMLSTIIFQQSTRVVSWERGCQEESNDTVKVISHHQSQPYAPPEDNRAVDTLTHAIQPFFTYQIATLLLGLNNYYKKTFMKLHKKLEKIDIPLNKHRVKILFYHPRLV